MGISWTIGLGAAIAPAVAAPCPAGGVLFPPHLAFDAEWPDFALACARFPTGPWTLADGDAPKTPGAGYTAAPGGHRARPSGQGRGTDDQDVVMANGLAVFNVRTAGASADSRLVIRLDNRTTVTIAIEPAPNGIEGDAHVVAMETATTIPAVTERSLSDAAYLTSLSGPARPLDAASIDGNVETAPNPANIPEPSTLAFFAAGLLGLHVVARRRRSERHAGEAAAGANRL